MSSPFATTSPDEVDEVDEVDLVDDADVVEVADEPRPTSGRYRFTGTPPSESAFRADERPARPGRPSAPSSGSQSSAGLRFEPGPLRSEGTASGIVIAALASLAAAVAVTLDAAPTGVEPVDAVLRGLLAAVVVVAAPRARPVTLLIAAALVAAGSVGWGLIAGLVALVAIVVSFVGGRRSPVVDAAVGGVIGVTALDLQVGWFLGSSAVLAALAVLPVLWTAYRSLPPFRRRPVRRVVLSVGVVGMVVVGVAAVTLLVARRNFVEAIDEIEVGATSLGQGDLVTARLGFGAAGSDFESASEQLDAWWLVPARAVPVLSQHIEVLQETAATGVSLSATALEGATEVDYELLNRNDGGVELGVLETFREPVSRAVVELSAASEAIDGLDSPWIVPPLRSRLDDVSLRVRELRSEAEIAALAVDELPGLLGGVTPRRYLVLLGNPAEARDLGGHIGNWAELVVVDGHFDLVQVGTPLDLAFPTASPEGVDLSGYPSSLVEMKPALFPQNWGADADLPTVAALSADLFRARTGRGVDGVMYADPSAFSEMLTITGPMAVPGLSFQIDSSNASDFLTREQYVLYANPVTGNLGVTQLVRDVFERLTSIQLPGPRLLGDLFFPEVRGGHLQFVSLNPDDGPLLARLGLEGRVPDPEGGDVLGIITRNANQNKIDNFLDRDAEVAVSWDPETGAVSETITVRLSNHPRVLGPNRDLVGNDTGLPMGTNLTDLAVLTPLAVEKVTVDGQKVAAGSAINGPLRRHTVRVALPPDGTAEVTFVLKGTVAPGDDYRLFMVGQPMVNGSEVRLDVHAASGDIIPGAGMAVDGSSAMVSVDGSTDTRVRVGVDR